MTTNAPIYNPAPLAAAILAASTGRSRVAVVTVGDSNNNYSTDGYNDGMERAAALAGVPLFASALMGYGGAANVGVGSIGGDIQATAETESLASLPAQLTGFVPSASHMPMLQPWWRNTNITSGNGKGYQLLANNALGNNALLRGHWWFGTGPSWGGNVQIGFRMDEAPYTQHVSASRSLTGAGGIAYGLRRETLDLAAGTAAADKALLLEVFRPGQLQTAPIFCPFMAVERPDRAGGVMVTPLVFAPSQHLGTIEAVYRTGCPDAWKTAHMQALWTLVNGATDPNARLLWFVSSGINDHSASRSAATFVADFERFRAEVLRVSALAGIDADRHLFLVAPTHPQNNATPDATLRGYIDALANSARLVPRVSVANLHSARFGDAAAWSARHDGGGAAHLKSTSAGYTDACNALWAALLAEAGNWKSGRVAVRARAAGVIG